MRRGIKVEVEVGLTKKEAVEGLEGYKAFKYP
jgi:hypothetical protein